MAGVGRSSIFDWRAADPSFERAFTEAYESGTDRFEAEARRRAFADSDALLIFLLKQRDPRRFNQKMLVVSGDADNPINVTHHDDEPRVIINWPANGRDLPEELPPDVIEGEAERDADDEAAA